MHQPISNRIQGEYRAYLLLDRLPAGCIAHPVMDSTSEPHLRLGEFAIIDPTDREPASSELFLIRWASGARALVSVKDRGTDGWWIGAGGRPWRSKAAAESMPIDAIIAEGRRWGAVDGPIRREHLSEKLVGRVVGILGAAPALDTAEVGNA